MSDKQYWAVFLQPLLREVLTYPRRVDIVRRYGLEENTVKVSEHNKYIYKVMDTEDLTCSVLTTIKILGTVPVLITDDFNFAIQYVNEVKKVLSNVKDNDVIWIEPTAYNINGKLETGYLYNVIDTDIFTKDGRILKNASTVGSDISCLKCKDLRLIKKTIVDISNNVLAGYTKSKNYSSNIYNILQLAQETTLETLFKMKEDIPMFLDDDKVVAVDIGGVVRCYKDYESFIKTNQFTFIENADTIGNSKVVARFKDDLTTGRWKLSNGVETNIKTNERLNSILISIRDTEDFEEVEFNKVKE